MILQRRQIRDTILIENTVRFDIAGTYKWTVPTGVTSVDVFLVGGGGAGINGVNIYKAGGGGGYTKTFRGTGYIAPTSGTWEVLPDGGRDGNAIPVTPEETIPVTVGAGGTGSGNMNGDYSEFKSPEYRAEGGYGSTNNRGGAGGSAGSMGIGASDGGNDAAGVLGQGHTTRDFGELTGKRNAAGGSGENQSVGGASDYAANSGSSPKGKGGGGYGGGGGGGSNSTYGIGGAGTVIIRYYTPK